MKWCGAFGRRPVCPVLPGVPGHAPRQVCRLCRQTFTLQLPPGRHRAKFRHRPCPAVARWRARRNNQPLVFPDPPLLYFEWVPMIVHTECPWGAPILRLPFFLTTHALTHSRTSQLSSSSLRSVLSKVLPSFQPYSVLNQSRFAFQAMQDKLSLRFATAVGYCIFICLD